MTVANNVFSYYKPSHISLSKPSRIMRALDSRVGEIALKVISSSSLAVGAALTGLSIAVIGFSIPTIVATAVFFKVGLVALYTIGNLKKYHKTDVLNRYKQEALSQVKALVFLDQTNFFKDKESKKEVLRPLSYVAVSHYGMETIFKKQLLSPNDFQMAFNLEIKHKDFFEALEFYNFLVPLYLKERQENSQMPVYTFFEKETLEQKFFEHFASLTKEIPWGYEEVAKAYKSIEKTIKHLDLLKALGLVTDEKLPLVEDLSDIKTEMQEVFDELHKILMQENILSVTEFQKKVALKSYGSFKQLENEQESFLKRVEKCQAEEEKEINKIESQRQLEQEAFAENPEMDLLIASDKDKKLQKIREKYKKRLEVESERSNLALKTIIQKCIQDQENQKDRIQDAQERKVLDAKEDFASDNTLKIQEFKERLVELFVSLSQVAIEDLDLDDESDEEEFEEVLVRPKAKKHVHFSNIEYEVIPDQREGSPEVDAKDQAKSAFKPRRSQRNKSKRS